MPSAKLTSIQTAIDKAFTAAGHRVPTSTYKKENFLPGMSAFAFCHCLQDLGNALTDVQADQRTVSTTQTADASASLAAVRKSRMATSSTTPEMLRGHLDVRVDCEHALSLACTPAPMLSLDQCSPLWAVMVSGYCYASAEWSLGYAAHLLPFPDRRVRADFL